MTFRKIAIVAGAVIFSSFLVIGVSVFGQKNNQLVYQANGEPVIKARAVSNNQSSLSQWEKEILARRESAIPRVAGAYADSLAKGFLEEYLKINQSGSALNENEIVEKILNQNPVEQEIAREMEIKYKISDLKLTSNNDATALKSYGNKIGEISAKYAFNPNWGSEADILASAMQKNNTSELSKLEPIINNYKNLISEYLKVETPGEIAFYHLGMINSLHGVQKSIENFRSIISDPTRGFFILTNYSGYGVDLYDSLSSMDEHFKKNGVFFSESEPGFTIERIVKMGKSN